MLWTGSSEATLYLKPWELREHGGLIHTAQLTTYTPSSYTSQLNLTFLVNSLPHGGSCTVDPSEGQNSSAKPFHSHFPTIRNSCMPAQVTFQCTCTCADDVTGVADETLFTFSCAGWLEWNNDATAPDLRFEYKIAELGMQRFVFFFTTNLSPQYITSMV